MRAFAPHIIVIGTQKDRPRVFLTDNFMQKFKTKIER